LTEFDSGSGGVLATAEKKGSRPKNLPAQGGGPVGDLTLRSVVLGISVVIFINLWVTYAETVVHASRLNLSFFQITLLFVFLIFVAILNPLLKTIRPSAALSAAELLVVVAIGMVGSVVPTSGIVGFMIGVISTPIYFASPENGWSEFYHPQLDSWIVPTNPDALRVFYEGLPPGASGPWKAWIPALAWWACLVGAIFTASASAMVILRKPWADHEKLSYPLVAVPLEMVAGTEDRARKLPEFMKGWLFWIPAVFAFLLFVWNSLSWFLPIIPGISMYPHGGYFRFTRYSPGIFVQPLQFFTMAFAYFANTQVLFSIIFFYLLHVVEGGLFNRLGYQIEASTDAFSADPPTEAWQCFGALAFMVVWRLWVARQHLKDVLLKALNTDHPADDTGEALSYRTAVVALVLSLVFVLFWFQKAGMDLLSAVMFLVGLGVVYLGMARVVSEAGVVYAQATVSPQAFVMDVQGTTALSSRTMTSLVLSYSLIDYMRGLFMPGLAHVVKIADSIRGSRRLLLGVIGLGVLAGFVASVWLTIYLGHGHGAYNFPAFPFFSGDPKGVFESTLVLIKTPKAFDPNRIVFFSIGAGLFGLMTFLRYRYTWWPIHPIGLTISAADNNASLVMPVFMVWAAKSILLRLGGVNFFNKAKPLFMGLMTGYTLGVVWSFAVDAIWFSGKGHLVHWW
jgi:hypothetical protein